jgi:hypothetical protein
MSLAPPPPPPPPPGDPRGDDLEQALDGALDRALALEGLYPFPAALAARIVADAVGAPGLGAGAVAARVAAAVVLAVAAWTAFLGRAPAPEAREALPALMPAPVVLPTDRALAAAPALPAPAAPWAAAGALALVAGGVVLARRWGTGLRGAGLAPTRAGRGA